MKMASMTLERPFFVSISEPDLLDRPHPGCNRLLLVRQRRFQLPVIYQMLQNLSEQPTSAGIASHHVSNLRLQMLRLILQEQLEHFIVANAKNWVRVDDWSFVKY
ncbi:MAG: hypothetical protein J7639_03805 [Paenibacillaceae bacterium]|nr:hypothetical protein [Paenibacillaceae bacterium]